MQTSKNKYHTEYILSKLHVSRGDYYLFYETHLRHSHSEANSQSPFNRAYKDFLNHARTWKKISTDVKRTHYQEKKIDAYYQDFYYIIHLRLSKPYLLSYTQSSLRASALHDVMIFQAAHIHRRDVIFQTSTRRLLESPRKISIVIVYNTAAPL